MHEDVRQALGLDTLYETAAAQPAADAFLRGLQFGITPKLEELGTIIGAAVAGYLVTYATTWVAPKNTGK